ncbi:highly divergent homeobox isoform X2 [Bombina bombina]|uniref:highly divergent homeobox isoform X2 n=1 Tax=Bombina bombina TaxID=8345 RepID=UPI00235AF757|nr:highly divergent homeobox isoform X2 [Bombina bombina]
MEGTVAPNVGEVTSTGSQGYQQETWVGNKRRKMSSKSYTDSGSSLQGAVTNSPSVPPEVAVRNVPNINRAQPPRISSSGDLMMTCVYSPNNSVRQGSTPQTQTTTAKVEMLKPSLQRSAGRNEQEYLKQHAPMHHQAPLSKNTLQQLDDKTTALARHPNVANPQNSVYPKKGFGGSSNPMVERINPQKTMSWSVKTLAEPTNNQRLLKAEHSSPVSHVPVGHRTRDSMCAVKNLEIREVFSLAATENSSRLLGSGMEEKRRLVESNCFSIAMETGDVDDEYAREEELASMGAQNQACSRFRESNSSPRVENRCTLSPLSVRTGTCKTLPTNTRDFSENRMYHNRDYYLSPNTSVHNTPSTQYSSGNSSRNSLHPHYTTSPQIRLSQNQNNYQISGNLTVPWITECSRKRTLQDRTQFSDRDLAMLKKYWDNGMTSLGSVCREKIEAVASELNVDCEIVRTWIGNRRRKYRLMGIEVPPPRGGPANFSELESGSSMLSSGDDPAAEVSEDNDRNDAISICLSEESLQAEEMAEIGRNEDISIKEDSQDAVPVHKVKVEVTEEEVNDSMSTLDMEQMHSLLDYKNEEMRFIESELERYKLKYAELQAFTRNLILAVKSNDKDQQLALLAEQPPELEDMDYNHTSSEPDDTSYSMSSVSDKHTLDSV